MLLDSLLPRQQCFESCNCKCNQHCYKQCHSAGLDAVCNLSCGCHSDVHSSNGAIVKSEVTEEPVQEVTELTKSSTYVVPAEQAVLVQRSGFLDYLVAADTQDFILTPETGFELIDAEANYSQMDTFKAIMATDAGEEDKPRCDPN
jgi:hypothetical protein